MRRFVTVLIALVLLNGITELHQFLKLPLLLSHLHQHRVDDPSLSLMEFLYLHYGIRQHPDDQDEQEDRELPFRSPGTIQHTDIPLYSQQESKIDLPCFIIRPWWVNHAEGIPCNQHPCIFHPPRLS